MITLICSMKYEKRPDDDIIRGFGESVCQLAWWLWSNAEPSPQHISIIEVGLWKDTDGLQFMRIVDMIDEIAQGLTYLMLAVFFIVLFSCWLDWAANQSCFSPVSLLFHFATEGGRCLEQCSLEIHVCCRSESRNGAKQGGMWAARDSNFSIVVSSTVCVWFFLISTVIQLSVFVHVFD